MDIAMLAIGIEMMLFGNGESAGRACLFPREMIAIPSRDARRKFRLTKRKCVLGFSGKILDWFF